MENVVFWHTGFLTDDLEGTIRSLQMLPGAGEAEIIEIAFGEDEMRFGAPLHVRICNFDYQGQLLELIQPMDEESFMAKELKRQGPGMHHLAYALPDCYDETVEKLKNEGWTTGMAACKDGINNCFVTSPDGAVILELIEKIPG